MEKLSVKVDVSKESYELAVSIADFVAVVLKEVKDNEGWSAVDDLPAIGVALVSMLPAFNGAASISAEMKVDTSAFIAAWLVAGLKIVDALKA